MLALIFTAAPGAGLQRQLLLSVAPSITGLPPPPPPPPSAGPPPAGRAGGPGTLAGCPDFSLWESKCLPSRCMWHREAFRSSSHLSALMELTLPVTWC